ncbi:MAG: hypothetical protein NVSMB63_00820 [Sediminibacterium sp.]
MIEKDAMKTNQATHNRPEGYRVLDAPYVIADINLSVQQMLDEDCWGTSDRNGITLFKTDNLTTVLICLRPGSIIGENTINGIVTLQVIEGNILLKLGSENTLLSTGQIMLLHDNVPHSLKATEETVLLLTNHVCS